MAKEPVALSEPWYRAVAVEQWVQAALPAEGWTGVVELVDAGGAEVQQARSQQGLLKRTFSMSKPPPLPSPAWSYEVVPLLRVLSEDAKPGTMIEVRADLRGPRLQQKVVGSGRIRGQGRVRHIDETVYLDRWLTLSARLADGTRVSIEVADRHRHRKVAKRSASGKHKTKVKEKAARRIDIEVAGRVDGHDLVVPTPPPRLPVYSKPGASRPTVTVRFDHPLPPPGGDGARLVLKALGEAHRHLQPRSRGAA